MKSLIMGSVGSVAFIQLQGSGMILCSGYGLTRVVHVFLMFVWVFCGCTVLFAVGVLATLNWPQMKMCMDRPSIQGVVTPHASWSWVRLWLHHDTEKVNE